MKKVLVTGGGGFLGRAIAEKLLARGDKVRSFSRGDYPELRALGVEVVQGDLADKESVRQACQGQDIVYHVAAKPGVWGKYEDYYEANVTGTINLVEACKEEGIKYFIYTSSPSVVFNGQGMENVDESVPYPEHYHAHYPKTKAIAEKYVIEASEEDFRTISLRPHLIWGPRDNHLVPRILARAKSLRQVGDGKNKVDTIYIDNAADAHIQAADHLEKKPELSGRVYFISQDDPRPLWEIVNKILAAGGKPPITRKVSVAFAYRVGAILETIYKIFRLRGEPKMTRFLAGELGTSHWFNISAAKKDFAYVPQVGIEEGFDRLREWLEQENNM